MDEKKTAWERLQLVHTKGRPTIRDYMPLIFSEFYEMHGDRLYGDDRAIIGGLASLDGIPVTIALPEKVIDAYNQGALPLGRLANAVLEKCDRLQQMSEAQERFEQESRTETRGITQR